MPRQAMTSQHRHDRDEVLGGSPSPLLESRQPSTPIHGKSESLYQFAEVRQKEVPGVLQPSPAARRAAARSAARSQPTRSPMRSIVTSGAGCLATSAASWA